MLFFAYATAYTAVDIGKVDYFAHVEYPSSMLYAGESDGGFLWKNKNAHDLIEYLKCLHAKGRFSMMLYCYHFNWVQKSDIGYLMQQMDSTEECAGIVFAHESRIAGASTVGIEARRIIISFWAGYYPSNLKVDDIKRDAILAWYEVWYSAYGKKMHLQNPKLEEPPKGQSGPKLGGRIRDR